MKRLLGIDYGAKRCGIAATDPLQILVSGVATVDTDNLVPFLKDYIADEPVEKVVIGMPTHRDGNTTYLYDAIKKLESVIQNDLKLPVDFEDESFSSSEAKGIIRQMGISKKKRRDKTLVDKVSAVLILQRYLGHI